MVQEKSHWRMKVSFIINNWITEMAQQLSFTFNWKSYLTCWSDVVSLYDKDRKSPIRLKRRTHLSTRNFFKGRVCHYSEGPVTYIELFTNWFKMNVKDKYSCVRYRNKRSEPWSFFGASFKRFSIIRDVIKSFRRSPSLKRIETLTSPTRETFVVTTEANILAAQHLLNEYKFDCSCSLQLTWSSGETL